ncbi:hypothetical protein A6A04_03785 [Paramagnetospirillum marisnigri]|uniref:YfhO family protein n=2 Tax=Paramagnetospirillum marisnigri TaxID=1285242 RepID=A0A178MKP7_9PROT|nr:hypothetical protein A6A04_03785 [Paramagnetospirillum marisnigri]
MVIGYFGLFMGQSFFIDGDCESLASFVEHNVPSSGWRTDMGVGLSSFMGDPGAGALWAPLGLITKLFGGSPLVFPVSVFALMLIAATAVHWLLRRVIPDPDQGWWMVPVAAMIVFSPLQHEFFFQRHWITLSAGAPLAAWLVVRYLERSALRDLLALGFLSALVFGFGSFTALMHLGAATIPLLIAHTLYFRRPVGGSLGRFVLVWGGACVIMLGLLAWTLYPMAIEQLDVSYARDPVRSWPLFSQNNLLWVAIYLSKFIHVGWLPEAAWGYDLSNLDPVGWENVAPMFPLVLAVMMFRRANGFWEFAAKWVVVGLWVWHLGYFFAPGLLVGMIQHVINAYPLAKFHCFIQVFELVLIASFLLRLRRGESLRNPGAGDWVRRILALTLLGFYGGLAVATILVMVSPDVAKAVVASVIQTIFPIVRHAKLLVMTGAQIDLLARVWTPLFVMFYVAGAGWALLFLLPVRLEAMARRSLLGVAGLILATNLLMSWTVYPLEDSVRVWDEAARIHPEVVAAIKPWERMAAASAGQPDLSTPEKWLAFHQSQEAFRVGYRSPPAIDLSYRKNLTQKNTFDFQIDLVNASSDRKITSTRALANDPPMPPHALLDIAAVQWVYSPRPLPPNDTLDLVMQTKALYLYRYRQGWPYAYLADGVEVIGKAEDILGKPFGPAYVSAADRAAIPGTVTKQASASLALHHFDWGGYSFDYSSPAASLLVVADAWHPRWKASLNATDVPVVKVNGIFKAAVLPAGQGRVVFTYDAVGYKNGVFISLAAGLIWLSLFFWSRRREPDRKAVIAAP